MCFMATPADRTDTVSARIYDVDSNDPESRLIDRTQVSPADMAQISELMAALGRLRDAEQRVSEASQKYMKLGRTDMRALHYLIVARHSGTIATPGAIATHLKISSASTTKLLDRLESAGHIERAPHPSDRRALAITITNETHEAAVETVGRLQSKRFHAATRLSSEQRQTVIGFLDDMTEQLSTGYESWPQTTGGPAGATEQTSPE